MEDEEPTCGKGLAAHSEIPRNMGTFAAAVAEVLEAHLAALDPADETSKAERDAYALLAREQQRNAEALMAIADRMVGYRGLPMGKHNESVMAGPRAMRAFEDFVSAERDLVALLQPMLKEDEAMLAEMRGS